LDGDLGGEILDVDGGIAVGFVGFWVVAVDLVAAGAVAMVCGALVLFAGW